MSRNMQNEIKARMNDNNWSSSIAQGVVTQKRRQNRRMLTISTLSSFSAAALVVAVYSFSFNTQTRNIRRGIANVIREAPQKRVPATTRHRILPVEFHGMSFGENRDLRLIDAALRSR